MMFKITLLFISLSSLLMAKSVGIIVNSNWTGEYAFALRLQAACKNLGWSSSIISGRDAPSESFSFFLTLIPYERGGIHPSLSPNYLVLFDPINHYYGTDFQLQPSFLNFSGYLTTFENQDNLGIKKNNICPKLWYPTSQYYPYRKVSPKGLFYFIGLWGNRLANVEYQILQKLLSEQSYTYFFGNPERGSQYGNAYKGSIPQESNSVLDTICDVGICLVLHSDLHIQNKIPSGRIFEAAAASGIIISDQNPFVQKHFGNAVLYIDQTKSGEEMFEQIDAHVKWIFTNLDKAQEMARRSHQIFLDHFLLEDQLSKFSKWHSLQLRKTNKNRHRFTK